MAAHADTRRGSTNWGGSCDAVKAVKIGANSPGSHNRANMRASIRGESPS